MLKIIRNRIEQGYRTSSYPKEPIDLYHRYRGLPIIHHTCDPAIVKQCAEICPQDAILSAEYKIDLGKCTFCGRCEEIADGAFVTFSQDFAMGTESREALICDGFLPKLAEHSKQHFKKLFGRSLQLRQVSAGGCNACEADTNVLNTPFFDLSRFGIDFVASPRHADGLHVTGPVSRNMKTALLATYEAIPTPKIVIASGACSISGGPFFDSTEITGGLEKILPVDLYIPGCPPHPLSTLHALLQFFTKTP
ncbi:hydrogenase [Desulfomarina profundi]|uniref:Hydrogenase n=1 Tax=Desulfomarina profundi TaxID=2772557 RepID=A0A8D5FJU7_9BACT|nr:hydrogenase [Desulfomarina profundi]BCL62170.1 hydrogenase [Desulfomarina profundi]